MSDNKLSFLAVGDLILNHPDPEYLFAHSAHVLRQGDIVFAQNEVPMTKRPAATCAMSAFFAAPAFVVEPEVANVLPKVGINVVSSAGNHTWDAGIPGIEDTMEALEKAGVASVGIGMDIDEARKPVILEKKGTKVGILSYNCTGPKETWANRRKPGAAFIRILCEYEMQEPCPGSVARVYTAAEPGSLNDMTEDIQKLREQCDIVVVHFHQGIGVKHAVLAAYEPQIAHAAIDAGADLVIGEHAHVCKGMELYKGKAVFYGTGNFACSMKNRQLAQGGKSKSEGLTPEEFQVLESLHGISRQWVDFPEEIKTLIGFKDGDAPQSQYSPESLQTFIVKVIIEDKKITRVGFIPCLINPEEQPVVLGRDWKGEQVARYLQQISHEAGLAMDYEWDGDEVWLK